MEQPARILMCPPDHYGIEYEINPWMSRRRPCDRRLAAAQWRALREVLEGLGAKIDLLPPVAKLPDLVFTANAALIQGDLAVLSHFFHPQRRGETPHFERWFSEQGFRVARLRSGAFFEGAGDALFCGEILFAGYRIRTDIRAHLELAELLSRCVISLELMDERFYHLDTCFCPLSPGVALYYPPAFDDYGRRAMQALIADLVPVDPAEAASFACNAVVVGKTVVTNAGCSKLGRELQERGFRHIETPLSEFIKAGGAAKCLTLRLDGEDAASPLPSRWPPPQPPHWAARMNQPRTASEVGAIGR